MYNPAYITLDEDGHVTLFWGDGTQDERDSIMRGPRPRDISEMAAIIEDLKLWAEEQGFDVVVPACDLTFVNIPLQFTNEDERQFEPNDVETLLIELLRAEHDAP